MAVDPSAAYQQHLPQALHVAPPQQQYMAPVPQQQVQQPPPQQLEGRQAGQRSTIVEMAVFV